MPTILTRRFTLREYRPSDRDAFVAYQTDPAFALFHRDDELGAEQAHTVFAMFLDWLEGQPRLNYQLAITPRDDDEKLIGSCGVRMEECAMGEAVFGIELARAYWGRYRYAEEVAAAFIDWAFQQLPLHALTAETAPDNDAVARLAKAAGFVQTEAAPGSKLGWRLERHVWQGRPHA